MRLFIQFIKRHWRWLGLLIAAALVPFALFAPKLFLRSLIGLVLAIQFLVILGVVAILFAGGIMIFGPSVKDRFLRRKFKGAFRVDDPAFREWFRPQLQLLRELDFFGDEKDKKLDEIERRLIERYRDEHGDKLLFLREDPMLIASFGDPSRAWQADLETDEILNNGYTSVVESLAAISRGAFHPEEIESYFDEDENKITLSFLRDGERHEYFPNYYGEWMDLSWIDDLNRIIAPSGMRFYEHYFGGQGVIVVVLREDEHARLKAAGWRI